MNSPIYQFLTYQEIKDIEAWKEQRTPIDSVIKDIVEKQHLHKKEYGYYEFGSALIIAKYKKKLYLIDGGHRREVLYILSQKEDVKISTLTFKCKNEKHVNDLYLQSSNINHVNPNITNGQLDNLGKKADQLLKLLQLKYKDVWHDSRKIFPYVNIGKFIEKIKAHCIMQYKTVEQIMDMINNKNIEYGKIYKKSEPDKYETALKHSKFYLHINNPKSKWVDWIFNEKEIKYTKC